MTDFVQSAPEDAAAVAPHSAARVWPRLRLAASLFRLTALYVLLCYAIVLVGLALRDGRVVGWGLANDRVPPASGVPALGVTVQWDGLDWDTRYGQLDRLRFSNIGWVRLRVDWGRAEPQPGAYQWQSIAEELADIAAAGLVPVVLLDGSPAWARAAADTGAFDQPLAPPADATTFADFAAAFAAHFGENVRFYQVWDEPNIAPHWGNRHIDPVAYAQLLSVAAQAIRSADRDAYIVSAALAPTRDRGHLAIDERFFLQRMIAAGAAPAFDALAVQPFGFGSAPTHSRQTIDSLDFQRAAVLRRALVDAGLADKPIWAIRYGWNTRGDSPWSTVILRDQGRYANEARTVAERWPWLATLGWAIDQPAAPKTDPIWGFALTDNMLWELLSPLPPLDTPEPWPPARDLALTLTLCTLTLLVAAGTLGRLPWRALRVGYDNLPRWVEWLLWAAFITLYYFATWPPLIGALWIGAALLMLARPQAGLWLALALLPFYYQHKEVALVDTVIAIPPATAAALALLPALVVTVVVRVFACAPMLWRTWFAAHVRWSDGIALAWLLINLVSMRNVWQWGAYGHGVLELVLVPLLLYVGVRVFVRDGIALRHALAALFGGGLLVALLGLYHWLQWQGVEIDGVRRLVGADYSPNQTALTLLRALFVGMGLALGMHGARRMGWLALMASTATALLLTASRGALLLGVPAGVACLLWLWLLRGDAPLSQQLRGLRRRRSVHILLVATPIVVLIALLLGEARLLNRDSVDNRLLLWQAALRLWQAFPLVGVGPGGFFWRYPAYLPLGATLEPSLRHPHNVWLELATGWGVLGLTWLLALIMGWLTTTARRLPQMPAARQWPAMGLAAALVAALAHAQVDAFLALPDLAGWLFAALALTGGLQMIDD